MKPALLIGDLRRGGSERLVYRLALGLGAAGIRASVYCLDEPGVDTSPLTDVGVTVRAAGSRGTDPTLFARLGTWFRRDHIDVVHAHCCAGLVAAFPAAKLLRLPLLHVWHGWPLGTPSRHLRLAAALDRWVDCVGINSAALRDRLRPRCNARRAIHLPNGLDLPPPEPTAARQLLTDHCSRTFAGPVILSVGNLRREKGTLALLDAFAQVRRHRRDAELVCIGAALDPEYARTVQQRRATLGLTDCAHLPGPLTDAWRLLPAADAVCLSSLSEAMPNVVLEALAQEAPLVATSVGNVGPVAGPAAPGTFLIRQRETGLIVPPGDADALAGALLDVLEDPQAARQRAARGRFEQSRYFSLSRMVDNYMHTYARLLRPCRRTPRVLMLGPAPPQVGGMVTSIGLLLRSPLQRRVRLSRRGQRIGPATAREFCGITGPPPRRRLLGSLWRHAGSLVSLARQLLVQRVDVLHIHTCSYGTFFRNVADVLIARLLGVRTLLHIRGNRFERFCREGGPLTRWLIRRGLESADGVIVLSEGWRRALAPYAGSARLHVVYNAFDPDVRAAAVSRNGARAGRPCEFLFLAAMTEAKGLGDLLAAAALLHARGVSFRLTVAGPTTTNAHDAWVDQAQRAGLGEIVRFPGPVSGAAKVQLLADADILVHPSHSEGLPNTVLEGAAAGLPVIATPVGAVPEALRAPGSTAPEPLAAPLAPLVPVGDVEALAIEMARLATDSAARQAVAAAVSNHVTREFSVDRLAERMTHVYASVLRRPLPSLA